MSADKDGGQAFPGKAPGKQDPHSSLLPETVRHPGMSLRDYFAGQALAGMMNGKIAGSAKYGWQELVAWDCYSIADAMLAERAK